MARRSLHSSLASLPINRSLAFHSRAFVCRDSIVNLVLLVLASSEGSEPCLALGYHGRSLSSIAQ
jgi:hypothetical protein